MQEPSTRRWNEALSWAAIHLARGLETEHGHKHHVRKGETWDTALLRVTAGHLAKQRYRLPIVDRPATNDSDAVQAALTKERLDDLWRVARCDVPSADGMVQGPRGRRMPAPRRRGWAT